MKPRMIGVTGGKGGTGKSFVATNIAYLAASALGNVVLADLDVEAPNDHLLLGLSRVEREEPIRIFFPRIIYEKCTSCGACAKVCDTGAIIMGPGRPPIVMPRLCSGCKACMYACPYKAIVEAGRVIGYIRYRRLRSDGMELRLLSGEIREGEEHTAPAVRYAKDRAVDEASRTGTPLIIDTGAGTGNSIAIALQDADIIVAVTEPTPLGLHDLRAILEVATRRTGHVFVVVNRHGIGHDDEHRRLSDSYGVEVYHTIPYDRRVVESYVSGVPIVSLYPESPVSKSLVELAGLLGIT